MCTSAIAGLPVMLPSPLGLPVPQHTPPAGSERWDLQTASPTCLFPAMCRCEVVQGGGHNKQPVCVASIWITEHNRGTTAASSWHLQTVVALIPPTHLRRERAQKLLQRLIRAISHRFCDLKCLDSAKMDQTAWCWLKALWIDSRRHCENQFKCSALLMRWLLFCHLSF